MTTCEKLVAELGQELDLELAPGTDGIILSSFKLSSFQLFDLVRMVPENAADQPEIPFLVPALCIDDCVPGSGNRLINDYRVLCLHAGRDERKVHPVCPDACQAGIQGDFEDLWVCVCSAGREHTFGVDTHPKLV